LLEPLQATGELDAAHDFGDAEDDLDDES
jgi:hypothetical protein